MRMLEAIEVSQVKRFAENTAGRDFAVGDLVDRGPECRDVLTWLDKPWSSRSGATMTTTFAASTKGTEYFFAFRREKIIQSP